MRRVREKRFHGESGGTLVMALVTVVVLTGMTGAMLVVNTSTKREQRAAGDRMEALYVAEAGLSRAIVNLNAGLKTNVGSSATPTEFSGDGGTWWTVGDNGDDTYTITSWGTVGGQARAVEVVMASSKSPIYANALFAGNSSGDPLYSLDLGGEKAQADEVDGSIYSANDVGLSGDASVTGTVRAGGTINGSGGEEGVAQSIPDITGMNYPMNHDFDVADAFTSATQQKNAAGGTAWQLPEADPCHIFRKNPTDRQSDWSATPKEDYFLEDPYEKVRSDSNMNGKDAYKLTLSGEGAKPGPSGNQSVYYIDGNLWIHNKKTYSLKFYGPSKDGLAVTFVVRGNIYFSDNLFYKNKNKDGVAFIAMKDPKVPDTGNIFFGDPSFGTLEHMDAFMYAENDFYDNNLNAKGSAEVTVNGNMTAGNQVRINRDFGDEHSKLTVIWDDRISTAAVSIPGLPTVTSHGHAYVVTSWREVPAN